MPLPRDDRGSTPPLCWLHGFTQTSQSAHVFRTILAGQRELLAPDLARHGANTHLGGTLDEIAEQVLAALPDHEVDLGGYSFGARVALHLVLAHPDRVRRLVLIGATRGIERLDAREVRRQRDNELAAHIELVGAENFIDEWLRQPMFAQLPEDPEERAARSGHDAAALAASLREAGTGTQRWLEPELRALSKPTLALAGADDVRFAREARSIAAATKGQVTHIPGAGHAAHLHQPAWSAALVQNFLNSSMGSSVDEAHRDRHRETDD